MHSDSRYWGLLKKKERWGPTWRGWLVALMLFAAAALIFMTGIHPFLAVTDRVNARILVVEGWVPEYAINDAVAEFRTGGYDRVYTTGGPVEGIGAYINDYSTAASIGAGRLRQAGLSADVVQMVPSHVMNRDRTYTSALALRRWFHDHGVTATSVNVLTIGVHARRTRLLFQEAFGDEVRVGIISVANPDFPPRRWWQYSEGVREVIGESIAYVYAKLFFWPSRQEADSAS